jgi:hypothetical protein
MARTQRGSTFAAGIAYYRRWWLNSFWLRLRLRELNGHKAGRVRTGCIITRRTIQMRFARFAHVEPNSFVNPTDPSLAAGVITRHSITG